MSSKRRYARIAITLPAEDLAAADRIAHSQDRSRSWVVAESIRTYVASRRAAVPARDDYLVTPGLGESRLAQLRADLRLTPEARVRAAEETARAVIRRAGRPTRRLLTFERYEDYLDWKQADAAVG